MRRELLVLKEVARLGGECSFSQLLNRISIPPSSLEYQISKLARKKLLLRVGRGRLRLAQYTPYIFCSNGWERRAAYFSLLGLKNGHEKPEYTAAAEKLSREGVEVASTIVATTVSALTSWGEAVGGSVKIVLLREAEAYDPKLAYKAMKPTVKELAMESPLICDVTSGPRPAALALFTLSLRLHIPVIYLREDTDELIWIVRPEEALEKAWKNIERS